VPTDPWGSWAMASTVGRRRRAAVRSAGSWEVEPQLQIRKRRSRWLSPYVSCSKIGHARSHSLIMARWPDLPGRSDPISWPQVPEVCRGRPATGIRGPANPPAGLMQPVRRGSRTGSLPGKCCCRSLPANAPMIAPEALDGGSPSPQIHHAAGIEGWAAGAGQTQMPGTRRLWNAAGSSPAHLGTAPHQRW